MSPPLIVIYNPVSGHGTANSFLNSHVIPLLSTHGQQPASDRIFETQSAAHAGQLVLEFLNPRESEEEFTIVLLSGDGTLHDIINALEAPPVFDPRRSRISFVLVPCGTANALYSSLFPSKAGAELPENDYKLQALQAYLNKETFRTQPLILARTQILSTDDDAPSPTIISLVVVSTSLHASILHDSEALRATMPGIERLVQFQ